MSDVSGIPNLGIPGLSGFNGGGGVNGVNVQSGLANAYDQYGRNQQYFGNQAQTLGAANVSQQQLYGSRGFGGDTAQAAATGAAYGRGTGGFNGGQQVAPAYGQTIADFNSSRGSPRGVPVNSSIFDTAGTGAVPYTGGPFMSAGRGPGGGSFSPQSYSPDGGPFQTASPGGNRGGGSVGSFFPTGGYQDPFNTPSMGNGGYGQAMSRTAPSPIQAPPVQAQFSPNDPNHGLFPTRDSPVMGTPDPAGIYQGFPHTEAGSSRAGANPGGANPFTSGADPISYLGGPSQAGRGFQSTSPPAPSPFDVGAPHVGATMGPFMGATPGGGVGRAAAPPDFAPSSPFDGGTTPFPFAGGYQGSMRDRIASAITGSPQGGPMVNGGPQGAGGPVPMPRSRPSDIGGQAPMSTPTPSGSQMNNAMDMLRQGRGWSIAQQTPPQQSAYAPINDAISRIGSVSRPGMFDNLNQPLSSMFSPGQYRGR